jgi:hypothetical protein
MRKPDAPVETNAARVTAARATGSIVLPAPQPAVSSATAAHAASAAATASALRRDRDLLTREYRPSSIIARGSVPRA